MYYHWALHKSDKMKGIYLKPLTKHKPRCFNNATIQIHFLLLELGSKGIELWANITIVEGFIKLFENSNMKLTRNRFKFEFSNNINERSMLLCF